jgi:hypothetical protein
MQETIETGLPKLPEGHFWKIDWEYGTQLALGIYKEYEVERTVPHWVFWTKKVTKKRTVCVGAETIRPINEFQRYLNEEELKADILYKARTLASKLKEKRASDEAMNRFVGDYPPKVLPS